MIHDFASPRIHISRFQALGHRAPCEKKRYAVIAEAGAHSETIKVTEDIKGNYFTRSVLIPWGAENEAYGMLHADFTSTARNARFESGG